MGDPSPRKTRLVARRSGGIRALAPRPLRRLKPAVSGDTRVALPSEIVAPAGAWTLPARPEAPGWPEVVLSLGVLGGCAVMLWIAGKVRLAELEAGQSPRRHRR